MFRRRLDGAGGGLAGDAAPSGEATSPSSFEAPPMSNAAPSKAIASPVGLRAAAWDVGSPADKSVPSEHDIDNGGLLDHEYETSAVQPLLAS